MFQILVVDDDKNTRRLLRAVLEQNGYTVITAANGDENVEALRGIDLRFGQQGFVSILGPSIPAWHASSFCIRRGKHTARF